MTAAARPVDTTAPLWAHLVCFAIAGGLFAAVAASSRGGQPLLTLMLGLVASPGLMALVGTTVMHRPLGQIFDPEHCSWAFLADIPLAFALALASAQWPKLHGSGVMSSGWWLLIAIAAGITAAVVFHFVLDAPNYLKVPGGRALLSDPTKLIHDEITYFVLSAGLVWAVLPVLVYGSWSVAAPWLICAYLLAWIGGSVHDTIVGLDFFQLHGPYDWANFRPLR